MEGIEEVFETDKINMRNNFDDIDIADFAEEYLGCRLLWYQKQMLRRLYKEHKDHKVFISMSVPAYRFSFFHLYKNLFNQVRAKYD